jgi:hypothetical protein
MSFSRWQKLMAISTTSAVRSAAWGAGECWSAEAVISLTPISENV